MFYFTEAVRVHYPSATEKDILLNIGATLSTAADRDGGRKSRNPVGEIVEDVN